MSDGMLYEEERLEIERCLSSGTVPPHRAFLRQIIERVLASDRAYEKRMKEMVVEISHLAKRAEVAEKRAKDLKGRLLATEETLQWHEMNCAKR